ncbi:hypothetical protein DDE05_37505, partial [Streptomyces cavourensis]
VSVPDVVAALKRLGTHLSAITGSQTDRMTRDDGWRLLTLGRQLERLCAMANLLSALFQRNAVLGDSAFGLLLDLFDSTITYRAHYPGRQEIPALLNLLVLEPANPRSIACVLGVLRKELARLPGAADGPGATLADLLPVLAEGGAAGTALAALCERDGQGRYQALLDLAAQLDAAASALSNEISRRYFSHASGRDQTLTA